MSPRSVRRLLGLGTAVAFAACTPLGLWVYDDPGLEVSRVRMSHDPGVPPVVLGLAVWNPNDYDLATARLELQLKLDDVPIGHFHRDSIIPVPQFGLADLALPLTIPDGAVRERIRKFSSGTHRFAVEGLATFSTPFGPRDVRFAHEGDIAFGRASEARVPTTVAADSVDHRARRGIYTPAPVPVPDPGR